MIELLWKNAKDGSVIRGWTTDTCSGTQARRIDFVDTHIDFGRVRPGSVGETVTVLLSIEKFDPADPPVQPITNCRLFMAPYYPRNSTQVVEIPNSPIRYSDTWRFCSTGTTQKTFSGGQEGGYWGSAERATDDISEVQMTWPEMNPRGGIEFSVDKGATWHVFSRTLGVYGEESTYFGIGNKHGGSTVENQIDPGQQAEIQFRARIPQVSGSNNPTAGIRLFLIGMEYDYAE